MGPKFSVGDQVKFKGAPDVPARIVELEGADHCRIALFRPGMPDEIHVVALANLEPVDK